jgi:hypothetical protein
MPIHTHQNRGNNGEYDSFAKHSIAATRSLPECVRVVNDVCSSDGGATPLQQQQNFETLRLGYKTKGAFIGFSGAIFFRL